MKTVPRAFLRDLFYSLLFWAVSFGICISALYFVGGEENCLLGDRANQFDRTRKLLASTSHDHPTMCCATR